MEKTISVKFFQSDSGNEPVREWLISLSKEDRGIIGEDIRFVELNFPVGMPWVRKIDTEYNLWEVRSTLASDKIARVIFTIDKGRMILLHAFIKKDQALPLREKKIAIDRLKRAKQK